jgi:uncharacterized protein
LEGLLNMDSVPLLTLLLFVAITGFAGLVHGTLGLGFPLVATPLLALLTDVRGAILLTLFPTVCVNVLSILRGGEWRHSIGRYWPLAAYAVAGSVLGTRLLMTAEPEPFRLLLAVMILVYLNLHLFEKLRMRWVASRPKISAAVFGTTAGFMAGTTNVMVPVLIIFALEVGLATTGMVQVFNLCFLAGKLAQVVTFVGAGMLGWRGLAATIPLALSAVVALLVGMRVRERVASETYRGWLRKLLYGFAVLLAVQFLAGWGSAP